MARRLSSLTAAIALVVYAAPAHAVLQDFGPISARTNFPTWYRDLNGVPLQSCLSTSDSPNAPGTPMCFPIVPNPAGYAGNLGDEFFYSDLVLSASGPGFSVKYLAALESAYVNGTPVKGDEMVFARIRVVISATVPGTYKVTHPYGVDIFPDVQPGPRAVFFTEDVGLVPAQFGVALKGRVGPFPAWDFVDPGFTLNVTTPTGVVEQFLGDPNLAHTFTGSPFGTNFLRVDGPTGSNISGVGDDFVQTPLANVLGQLYTAPIPTPLRITRSSYSRDAATGVTSIDVFANTAPGKQLIVSGADLPTTQMITDGAGRYISHVELAPGVIPPASITVTNVTDVPASATSAGVSDLVAVSSATFDSLTKTLKVTAASSDQVAPPLLSVLGPVGGPMAAGSYSTVLSGLWPQDVTVASSAGGSHTEDVLVLPNLLNIGAPAPVAVADAITVDMNGTFTFSPAANDVVALPVAAAFVVVPAANGTATSGAGGVITYKPALNFSGTDTFSYVAQDATGKFTNVATVTATVRFVAVAPTANADSFAVLQNSTVLAGRTVSVIANDFAAAGTTINPASVTIVTAPLHGTAVANADGTVTYTPALRYAGADSFRYTVANTAGTASAAATVSIVVEGGAETLSLSKADYRVSTGQWTIVGSTNWFGPTLTTSTVTCWVGKGVAVGPKIGTQLIDTAGKFQLVAAGVAGPDATNVFTCQSSNSTAPAGTTTAASGVLYGVVTRR
ncbi:MAG TPA: Ig-like domain-containing protein [Anaeromyxobacteraceae bacterium]|nr:Ig-like domain-containing protein [Anaeromyxobacteraceae bacterium]